MDIETENKLIRILEKVVKGMDYRDVKVLIETIEDSGDDDEMIVIHLLAALRGRV